MTKFAERVYVVAGTTQAMGMTSHNLTLFSYS